MIQNKIGYSSRSIKFPMYNVKLSQNENDRLEKKKRKKKRRTGKPGFSPSRSRTKIRHSLTPSKAMLENAEIGVDD